MQSYGVCGCLGDVKAIGHWPFAVRKVVDFFYPRMTRRFTKNPISRTIDAKEKIVRVVFSKILVRVFWWTNDFYA
jgi:hypothetical protein